MKIKIILIALVFIVVWCNVNHPIIEEMDDAYTSASNKKNSVHEENLAATALAVQKYFPMGMRKVDALALLNKLDENGFEVLELNYMGTRIWPNKEFRHYPNVNREKHYPRGTTGYVAQKKFLNLLIFTKTAAISIKLDNSGTVVESEGRINTDSI